MHAVLVVACEFKVYREKKKELEHFYYISFKNNVVDITKIKFKQIIPSISSFLRNEKIVYASLKSITMCLSLIKELNIHTLVLLYN